LKKWCEIYQNAEYFKQSSLYRIFYYDSLPPSPGSKESIETHFNPFTQNQELNYEPKFIEGSHRFWKELSAMPFFAMRKGTLSISSWEVSKYKFQQVMEKLKNKTPLEKDDLVKKPRQKQVDMKVGMDVAHVCIKGLVSKIILVAGDSDFAPAAKLARVEGVQVFLDSMGHKNVRDEFLNHVDVTLG
jgi:uncharacterized LabA/DUF88 family protein